MILLGKNPIYNAMKKQQKSHIRDVKKKTFIRRNIDTISKQRRNCLKKNSIVYVTSMKRHHRNYVELLYMYLCKETIHTIVKDLHY